MLTDDPRRQFACQSCAQHAVGEGGQVRAVFLEHTALQNAHNARTIQRANLARIEIPDLQNLRQQNACDE